MSIQEERYKFVTSQVSNLNDKILDTFAQFILLISALTGGIFWLRARPEWPTLWPEIRPLANSILFLIGFQAVLRIFVNLAAWWGYRRAEVQLTDGAVPPPRFPWSCVQEILLVGTVAVATVGGIVLLQRL